MIELNWLNPIIGPEAFKYRPDYVPGDWFRAEGPCCIIHFINSDIPFNNLMTELYYWHDDLIKLNAIARYANQFKKAYPLAQIEYLKKEFDRIMAKHDGSTNYPNIHTQK